jgi:tetratricopeptide (TPR) repeat protein
VACAVALLLVVGGCGKGGNKPAGKSLIDQFNDAKKIADPQDRAEKLISIAKKQIEAKDSRSAETSLKEASRAIEAYQGTAEVQAKLYLALGAAYQRADSKKEAAAALDAAAQAIPRIESVATQTDNLAALAGQRAAIGEEDAARENLKEAEKLLAKVEMPLDKIDIMAAIMRAYATLKSQAELDRLLAAGQKLADDHPNDRVRILLKVSTTQHAIGQTDAAKATLDKAITLARGVMGNPLLQGNLLYEAAEVANTTGQLKLCSELLTNASDAAKKSPEGKHLDDNVEALRRKLKL